MALNSLAFGSQKVTKKLYKIYKKMPNGLHGREGGFFQYHLSTRANVWHFVAVYN